MRRLLAVSLAFAVTPAAAKPSPVELVHSANPAAFTHTSAEFNIGPAGATLERNYFRGPEATSRSGLYLCRLEPNMFAKVRLNRSCR